MRRAWVAVALLLATTSGAQAIECRPGKGDGSYWQWRLIDGKRCWYPGRRRVNKSALHWVARSTTRTVRVKMLRTRREEPQPPPVLEAPVKKQAEPTEFDLRFRGGE